MLNSLPLIHGDAHGAQKPIMVASIGSIFGSYPFVTSLPDFTVPAGNNWHSVLFRGNEDDRLEDIKKDTKILSRQPVRFQTMRYVVQEQVKPAKVIKKNKSQVKTYKKYKKSGSVIKPKVKSSLTFGSVPVQQMSINELHNLLINHLEVEVLPTLRIEPSYPRKKLNKELLHKFRHDISKKIVRAVFNFTRAVDPTILLDEALKNAASSRKTYKGSLSLETQLLMKRIAESMIKQGSHYRTVLANIKKKNTKKKQNNKINYKINNKKKCAKKNINQRSDTDNPKYYKNYTKRRASQAYMTSTKTKTKQKKPTVETIYEDQDSDTNTQGSLNLISFEEQAETPAELTDQHPKFAIQPEDKNLQPPIETDLSVSLPPTPSSAVQRVQPEVIEKNIKIQKVLQDLQRLGVNIDAIVRHDKQEPTSRIMSHTRNDHSHVFNTTQNSNQSTNTDASLPDTTKITRRLINTRNIDTDNNPSSSDNSEDNYYPSSSTSNDTDSSDSSSEDISIPEDLPQDIPKSHMTDYWLAMKESARKLKKARKKIKKRKKKAKSSADVIFRYLMKAASDYELPALEYNDIPGKRRGRFNDFMYKLKFVTSAVRQTKNVLSDPTDPKAPKNKAANQALYRVICTKIDLYVRTQLDQLTATNGHEDGYKALLLLQDLFANKDDPDYQQHAENLFKSIKLRDNETIFSYNKRFGYLYRNYSGCGTTISETERARLYLRGLQHHTNTNVLYEVKNYIKTLGTRHFQGLTEIQRLLLREEEQSQPYSYQPPKIKKDRNGRPITHANSASGKQQKPFNKANVQCHGCKKFGHFLKECRTTNETDKKRIWDMIKNSQKNSKPKDKNNLLTSNNSQAIHPSAMESNASKVKREKKIKSALKKAPTETKTIADKVQERKVLIKDGKPFVSYASSAQAKERIPAYASMAKKDEYPPYEGDLPDPYDVHPPPLYDDQVLANPNSKEAIYEEEVLLDSGASDCMVPSFLYLDLIRNAYHLVTIADGTLHESNYQGVLRIAATCRRTGQKHVVPMLDTLLVPGLQKILWSVPALCSQGHDVIFGMTTVRIQCHAGTEDEFVIYLQHPMILKQNQPPLPFPTANHTFAIDQIPQDLLDKETLSESDDDSSTSSCSMPELMDPASISSSSPDDSSSYSDVPDLESRAPSTDSSEGYILNESHAPILVSNQFDDFEQDPLANQGYTNIEHMDYQKQKAYLCDMHDLPEDPSNELEYLEEWTTPKVDTSSIIPPQPHIIPNDTPVKAYPIYQFIPTRPERPKDPYRSQGYPGDSRIERQDYLRWKSEMETYLDSLPSYQGNYLHKDEPLAYDPFKHPEVPHAFNMPYDDISNPESHWQDEEYQAALRERKDLYDKAQADFLQWDKADRHFTSNHEQHAQGHSYLTPGSPKTASQITSQASQAESNMQVDSQTDQTDTPHTTTAPKKIPLGLMHRRFGHRSSKSLLLADESNLYSDIKIIPEQDQFCATCKISTIRTEPRGPPAEERIISPGQILYLDVQPNMAKQALNKRDYFPNYINIVDAASRKYRPIGTKGTTSSDVIHTLYKWAADNKPVFGYNFNDHCEEIHVDAGSQLISEEFKTWCEKNNAKLAIAAPHHQEMNGICERFWQSARKIAFSLLTNARLGWPFYHYALEYAAIIMDLLPVKGCIRTDKKGDICQSCPDAIFYNKTRSKAGRLRVFGCPVIAKVYKRKTIRQEDTPRINLDSRNIVQRGVRGIFVGLPHNQAGWSIYVPQSNRKFVSADVAFDEDFETLALAYDKTLYHDAIPTRGKGHSYIDNSREQAFTGPPHLLDFDSDPTVQEQEDPDQSNIYEDEIQHVDTFELITNDTLTNLQENELPLQEEPQKENDPNEEYIFEDLLEHRGPLRRGDPNYQGSMYNVKLLWEDGSTSWEPLKNIPTQELIKYAQKKGLLNTTGWKSYTKDANANQAQTTPDEPIPNTEAVTDPVTPNPTKKRKRACSLFATTVAETVLRDGARLLSLNREEAAVMMTETESEIDAPGSDPAPFLQLPRDIKDVDKMSIQVARGWTKSFVSEVIGILIKRRACKIEDPGPDDKIIPVMATFRTKLDMLGLLDKLKTRIVFRGDLYQPKNPQNAWNPHAQFLQLKLYLADSAKDGTHPRQLDFLLAFLQAEMKERVFVIFPEHWKKYLPEHLHKWIGRPLLLLRALYGYNYSGKFLYQDQASFLDKQGFKQAAPGYWVKKLTLGRTIRFLHYVDDILVDSQDNAALDDFIQKLGERFDIDCKPRADWYLQTRIQQDKDKNITLDQTRYSKSMIQRFLPQLANQEPTPQEMTKYQSPMKSDCILLKEDNAKTKEESEQLEEEFGFKYLELIGCFNWLSYTCYEELFCIRRLCRSMNMPGRKHFLAALHLLHHFRCHSPKPLIFYHDHTRSPIVRMLQDNEQYKQLLQLPEQWTEKQLTSHIASSQMIFADSSHCDAGEGRSTACDLQVYQGGIIDHTTWVPEPVSLSTAESENNCYSVAIMKARYITRILTFVRTAYEYVPLPTIPIFVDSNAAIAMNESDNITRRARHIESRYWYGRLAVQRGEIRFIKVNGKTQQPADIGTKNVQEKDARKYLNLFEAPYYT